MADADKGRPNQRQRTRKDLLRAAARSMKEGRRPSFEEVAEEALVSRATAYRYFPGLDALLVEASLDIAFPEPEALFADAASDDPVERLERADAAVDAMIAANAAALRMMLRHSLDRALDEGTQGVRAVRQNRRTPLIEAALAPARGALDPAAADHLVRALALVIGTESMLVFNDVLELGDADARATKRWIIRALVDAARKR